MSEKRTDAERDAVIVRNRDYHTSNKINVYFANINDYRPYSAEVAVTPWLGDAVSSDRPRMDLSRWKLYDDYILRLKENGIFAELWFFVDDNRFGGLSQADKNRLFRYALVRTSALSHIVYVIALEWQEG